MDAADHDKVQLLADLQAGLLDDQTAARVRRQARTDPQAQQILRALNQVRREVAAVGADPASAPDPPAEAIARITEALAAAGRPGTGAAHFARPQPHLGRIAAAGAGACALLAAIGMGTAALIHAPTPIPSTSITAEHLVSRPPVPLSRAEILGLLDRPPAYGPAGSPLADPARRASCLGGLGYPASTRVLGARPIEVNARPGVLLVLPGDPADLAVLVVAPNCGAADTGVLAATRIPRP